MSFLRSAALAATLLLAPLAARAEEAREDRLSGFTAGAFFGMAVMDSTVDAPNPAGGPPLRFVDQGGDGMIYGLRLGYGRLLDRGLYLGAELEGLLPIAVTSRLNAAGVVYRARLREEIGGYLRAGYAPDGRTLLYIRAGLTMPHQVFETGVAATGNTTPHLAIGAGAEVFVTPRIGIRLDGTWDMPAGRNDLESYRVSAGFVFRF